MSARDVWGFSIIRYFIVGLSCVRAAYVHDVCVWFWRASRRSCQVGARCGHFGWRVLLTAALSCRPLHSFTAPFRSEMSGASALGTCVFSLARASAAVMRHVCVWPACELLRSFRSLHGGRFCVASAADRCAELSPPVKHYCAISARCLGLQRWVLCVFLASSCVRAAYMHDVCVWLWRASWRSSIGIARWSL